MDSLVANLHLKPLTPQSSAHANDGKNFSSKQVLWKTLLVCLSAVWVKTSINFLINILLKKCILIFLIMCFMHLLRHPISLSEYNIADFVIYNVHLSGLAI